MIIEFLVTLTIAASFSMIIFYCPMKKKCPENVIEIVRNLSGIYFSCPENIRKMSGKMIKVAVWNFSFPKNQTNSGHEKKISGHIPDMQKIWTKSGQINWTNSEHEKFQKFFPDIFWT